MSRRIVSIICKTDTSIASVKFLLGKIFSCLLFIPAKCQLFQTQEFTFTQYSCSFCREISVIN